MTPSRLRVVSGPEWPRGAPRRGAIGPKRPAGRRAFGSTWWGAAWIEALEGRASLDPNRLPRGRSYARSGAVGPLRLEPGLVSAEVQGSRARPYRVGVRVRAFDAREWDRVLEAFAAQAGHAGALLEGELPAEVASDVRAAGLDLLPGAGEVQPRCTCPDWAEPCKHSAAVCYLVADALDEDPFVLLRLRGRGREEVMAGLRALRSAPGAGAPPASREAPDPGIVAREAWARIPAAPPSLPSPPPKPGRPSVLPLGPPPSGGQSSAGLAMLAEDAAARAWAALVGEAEDLGLELDEAADLARRAAALLGSPALEDLARRSGIGGADLVRRALAWRHGGAPGLRALIEPWDPPPALLAPGRALLGTKAVARRNRLTAGDRQLRLGEDGLWYPYRRARGGWDPDGQPLAPGGQPASGA